MAKRATQVWQGAAALEPFLVPIDTLEPFPGNPRRGDVATIRESLQRFGQVRAILIDGTRIIAGHHFRLAAVEEGWTHIAAIPNEFSDEEEARAYLLADNRLNELGGTDNRDLVAHLQQLAEFDGLAGTGYALSDLDDHLAHLAALDADMAPEPIVSPAAPEPDGVDLREFVLIYSPEQAEQVEGWLRTLAETQGTSGVSETVYECLAVAVEHLT